MQSTRNVLDEEWVYASRRRVGEFVIFMQSTFRAFAMNRLFTRERLRVFLYLCTCLEEDTYIVLAQKDIAKALEMQPSHVSRAMKFLVERGMLIRGDKVGLSYSLRLPDRLSLNRAVLGIGSVKSSRA